MTAALIGEVLKTAFRSANNYSAEARRLVFDVCIRLVKDRMSEVPTLKVWAADETGDWDSGYYSNVPQPYITQVNSIAYGEHTRRHQVCIDV